MRHVLAILLVVGLAGVGRAQCPGGVCPAPASPPVGFYQPHSYTYQYGGSYSQPPMLWDSPVSVPGVVYEVPTLTVCPCVGVYEIRGYAPPAAPTWAAPAYRGQAYQRQPVRQFHLGRQVYR